MAQQFDYPNSETDLRDLLDTLYETAKTARENRKRPVFKGLVELMSAQATIITAIHNIKANKGSQTPGVDDKTMRKDYLQKPLSWVIRDIQSAFRWYEPQQIRRKYIDKPGKAEKRPLGIPTIRDRIIQECMRIILEPILEAQFFEHSYGFRPMRDTHQALVRITDLVFRTGYFWIVEGDISKCFDKLNHTVLLRRLYHLGIKDRRVLQMIKAMMRAGIIGECEVNEDGVQQGGILSPLLANVGLDIMDQWITGQWEQKTTRYPYKDWRGKSDALRKGSQLMPGYLVRYADDFVIITDSREHAQSWKDRLQHFLGTELKLSLSPEKTLITDVRKQYVQFLGYEYKVIKGKGLKGYIPRTIPNRKRLQRKVDAILKEIKEIPRHYSREEIVKEITRINSEIRGLVNYYSNCTWVSMAMKKHDHLLQRAAKRRLGRYKSEWIPASDTRNLPRIHGNYKQKIPAIRYSDFYVGVTSLSFCKWEKPSVKNHEETPYTQQGRQLYFKRTKKKRQNARLDHLYSEESAQRMGRGNWDKVYNFEFYMNRAYALSRDKLKCRICGGPLLSGAIRAHHINPNLPLETVNRVNNLASMHKECQNAILDPTADLTKFESKARKKIEEFRKKLVSHVKSTV